MRGVRGGWVGETMIDHRSWVTKSSGGSGPVDHYLEMVMSKVQPGAIFALVSGTHREEVWNGSKLLGWVETWGLPCGVRELL